MLIGRSGLETSDSIVAVSRLLTKWVILEAETILSQASKTYNSV